MVPDNGCLEGFASAVRGDATLRRFEEPTANLVFKHGHLSFGIEDKAARKIISHAFEELKRQENESHQDKITSRPEGPRFKAAYDLQHNLQRLRSEEEQQEEKSRVRHQQDTLAGNLHQLPVYHTSQDNPLLPHLAAPTNSTAAAEEPVQCRDPLDVLRARSLNSHLDLGSCVPLEEPAPPVDLRIEEARQAELKRQQELKELELELITLYPHGVPKRIQADMMRVGLMLPGTGFAP